VMASAVKMLDLGGIGAGKPQLRPLTSPYGVRLKQTKLQKESLHPKDS
jgi:hypothetical protein